MSTEKLRAEFEGEYKAQFGRLPQNWNAELVKYFDAHAQGAWWAWQASRACLVVELPEPASTSIWHMSDMEVGYGLCLENCRAAIESAGIRTTDSTHAVQGEGK